MAQIKYQITGAANTGPIVATSRAVENLATSSSGVQDAMMGLQAASQGSFTAVFSLARAVKGLWLAFQAGQMAIPILAAATVAVWALSKAWTYFRGKQEEANQKMQEAGAKMDALIQRMRELRKPVEVKLNLDAEKSELANITKQFEDMTRKADDAADAARRLRAAQKDTQLAAIDQSAAADPDQTAANQHKYDVQRQAVTAAADAAEIEARRNDLAERRARIEEEIIRLTTQKAPSRAVAAGEKRVTDTDLNMIGARGDPEAMIKATQERAAARAELERIRSEEEARQKTIADQIADREYALQLISSENTLLNAGKTTIQARIAAEQEILALRQKQIAATDAEKKKQDELKAAKEAAAATQKSDAAKLGALREIESEASGKFGQLQSLATSSSARAAARRDTREKARAESKWEKEVARAKRAEARGGGMTQHTRDVLAADAQRELAEGAKGAADALEQKMASDIGSIAIDIAEVKKELINLMTMK